MFIFEVIVGGGIILEGIKLSSIAVYVSKFQQNKTKQKKKQELIF